MEAMQKIQELLGESDEMLALIEQAAAEIRADMLRDIMIDMADFANDAHRSELSGWRAATEMLKSNY